MNLSIYMNFISVIITSVDWCALMNFFFSMKKHKFRCYICKESNVNNIAGHSG